MQKNKDSFRLTSDQFSFDESGRLMIDATHLPEMSDQSSVTKPFSPEEAGITIKITPN